MDKTNQRFICQLESDKPGSFQKAFQLTEGTEEAEVIAGNGNVWETGTVNSSVVLMVYNGP